MNIPFSPEGLASHYPSIAEQAALQSGLPSTEVYPIWNRVVTGLERLGRYGNWWEMVGDQDVFDVGRQLRDPDAVISEKSQVRLPRLTPEQRRLSAFSPINAADRAEVDVINSIWNSLAAIFRSASAVRT